MDLIYLDSTLRINSFHFIHLMWIKSIIAIELRDLEPAIQPFNISYLYCLNWTRQCL